MWEHWDYDDEAMLYIEKPGGLAHGMHRIGLQQSILAAYGYMPTDEEWIRNRRNRAAALVQEKHRPYVITTLC